MLSRKDVLIVFREKERYNGGRDIFSCEKTGEKI